MSRRPPILDPRSVPVSGNGADLPAVPAERLRPEFLRQRFARPPDWQPELAGDAAAPGAGAGAGVDAGAGASPASSAAVLLPLVMREQGLHVLLTRRTAHLRKHAGQISFPGGRSEDTDAGPEVTALRETEEEIGIPRARIELIGSLPVYTTVTSFQVTPVVGLLRPDFSLRLHAGEVAEAFEVPLQFLMTPAHHQLHRFVYDGGERQFLSMPWTEPDTQAEYFIWGATAAMLRNFYRFLSA